jgi:2-polyprenyl-3-methyl-5-hydroxy-6-metoxy-1,4-benzoquinol methylase
MDLKETEILGESISEHWYYRSKAKALSNLLGKSAPKHILDVGAGSGFFSRYLLANSSAQLASCVDISYPEEFDDQEAGKPILFRRSIEKNDADVVLLMDVLEHVDDDVGLLAHYVEKAPMGARFVISVPAFEFLWSGHDVFLEHKRRYQLAQLEQVVKKAGLKVTQGGYFFGAVFPIAAVMRLVKRMTTDAHKPTQSDLSAHHPLVNGILAAACSAEVPLMKLNRLAGLTVFCLAQKNS